MAKFRTNHQKRRRGESSGMIVRAGIFFVILIGAYFGFKNYLNDNFESLKIVPDFPDLSAVGKDSIFFLPKVNRGFVVQHNHFAFSFVEKWQMPEWLAYELVNSRITSNQTASEGIIPDPKLAGVNHSLSTNVQDQSVNGFWIPPSDIANSKEAFYASNSVPMHSVCRTGIWNELEEQGRNWARQFGHLYVITGPVIIETVGTTGNSFFETPPKQFYKVFLDLRSTKSKSVGFLIPNENPSKNLMSYMVSVDSVESATGLDFFGDLVPEDLESNLEKDFDKSEWK